MNVDVSYLAVFLAAVSSMVVGSVWYARGLFGDVWANLAKVDMNRKPTGKEMAWLLSSTFVASLVTAYVLAHVIFLSNQFMGGSFLVSALSTACWLWLGLVATTLYVHDAFEGRRKKLTLLNAAYQLVMLLVMACIIGMLKP